MKSLSQHINESFENALIVEALSVNAKFSLNDQQENLLETVKKSKFFKNVSKLGNIEKVEVLDYHPISIYSGLTFVVYLDTNIIYYKAFEYDKKMSTYSLSTTRDYYDVVTSDGSKISGGTAITTDAFVVSSKILDAVKFIVKGKLELPSESDIAEIDRILKSMLAAYINSSYYTIDRMRVGDFSYTKTRKINTQQLIFSATTTERQSPNLHIVYDFVSKNIEVTYGRYIGNLSNGYKSLKASVKMKKGSVLDNILRIAKDKALLQQIAKPLQAESSAKDKSFADFYANRQNAD